MTRTVELIRRVTDKKARILIPAPVLTEFLVGLPPAIRNPRILTDLFAVASYDAHCAHIAADLQANLDLMKRIRQTSQIPRQCLKVDTMIVATAIAYKSTSIYTHNMKHFHDIAQGRIIVQDIETMPTQRTFLGDPELDDSL